MSPTLTLSRGSRGTILLNDVEDLLRRRKASRGGSTMTSIFVIRPSSRSSCGCYVEYDAYVVFETMFELCGV